MNTTVEALKALYVALGGSADDVANITIIPDMINAIATKAALLVEVANAKELPAVKAADNDKVLTVVSGKWAAANLPD